MIFVSFRAKFTGGTRNDTPGIQRGNDNLNTLLKWEDKHFQKGEISREPEE